MKFRFAILTLGILLILFSISGMVNALVLDGDFTVETDCVEPTQRTWFLENDDSVTHTYSLHAQGDHADWININGKWVGKESLSVTLNTGETKFLYAFIKADSCFIKPGSYEIPLIISNEESIERTIIVEILESRTLELNAFENEITSGQCEPVSFEFGIGNTGKLDETVLLEVSGLDLGWYSLEVDNFTLEKNTSRTVALEINAPCDTALEIYEFEVTAKLEKSYFETSEKFTYEITDTQEIELLTDSIIICNDEVSERTITLRNNGNFADKLMLTLSASDWVSLNDTSIEIEANTEKEITLTFSEHDSEEDAEIMLEIYSIKFNKMTNKVISVSSDDCYNAEIGAFTLPESVCQENADSVNVTFDILNTGTKNIALRMQIEGINAILSQETVEIMPLDVAKIAAVLDFGSVGTGTQPLTIKAENPFFSTEHDYSIEVIDCYAMNMNSSEFDGKITIESEKEPILVTLFIGNAGSRRQSVEISFEGPSWIYFEPQTFELGLGETQEVYFYISPSLEVKSSEYESTIRITGFDFDEEVKLIVGVEDIEATIETNEEVAEESEFIAENENTEDVSEEGTTSEESEETENEELGTLGTGLFILANGGSLVIIVLFLVVVALLAYFSRSSAAAMPETKATETEKTGTAKPKKETSKKVVSKKSVSKKPAVKKKTAKPKKKKKK